ncbi:MAG: hypothetical protein ABSC05_12105 [Candidatus Solibacter sp.]|jgi:hypothetical protein
MKIEVESYSGHKADERPARFRLGERWIAVEQVVDRWRDPEATYFKVRGNGDVYILRHDEREDAWMLASYRRV